MPLARLLLALNILCFISCSSEPPPPQLTEVIVDTVRTIEYNHSDNLVGRLHAHKDIEIKSNVTGYLKDRTFKEGDYVEKGKLLFLIDPATYEADLAGAKAELAQVLAAQKVAKQNYLRGEDLFPKGALSVSEMDKLTGNKLQADANIKRVESVVKAAEVNLSYTKIMAPISGQIGRSQYGVGDLITPQSGALTTLVDADPIQVKFQISESSYLGLKNERERYKSNGDITPEVVVAIELSDGERYPLTGKVDYIANRIDETTGTIEGRAIIPNPENYLKPGQYVNVIFEIQKIMHVLSVPQMAIQADQQGNFALVVNNDGVVARRNLVLGKRIKESVIVIQGINERETIIVRGLQQVRPGQKVTTKYIQPIPPSSPPV